MKIIQSKKYKIANNDVNKILLSSFDDKKYILNDGTTTLAYFHKDLLITHILSKFNSCKNIKRF